jgi:probable phosphoglycerate mutase
MRSLPESRRTRFILIRHGQSDFNLQSRIQGCSDEPALTDLGRSTADRAAEYLRRAGITRVLASPLRRAFEFAARIRAGLGTGADLCRDNRLREIELPLWEGLEIATVKRTDPEAYRCWRERPDRFVMGARFQPLPELYARAVSFWRACAERFEGETVLVVTHSGTVRALIAAKFDISPARFHSIQQSNGGLTILDSSPAGFELICLNATGYLGERFPKLKEGRRGRRVVLLATGDEGMSALEEFRPRIEACSGENAVPMRVRVLDPADLRRKVAQALGSAAAESQLRKISRGLSVMHYPDQDRPPVVQMIELPESQVWAAGNQEEICA